MDLPGSRQSLVGFGVPQRASNVLGTALPFVELMVALALLFQPTAMAGAIGALVLLLAFCTGISNALRQGEAPPCNCFGAIHSAPASGWTLARNVVLAAAAGIAVGWGPGPAIDTWFADRSAAELIAIFVGLLAIFLLVTAVPMWFENRRLLKQLEKAEERLSHVPSGLRIGSLAPEFAVPDDQGGAIVLSELLARGKPVVLVWTVAGCGPCEPMLPYLRRLQSMAADRVTIALVGISTVERYERAQEAAPGGWLQLRDATAQDPVLQEEMDQLQEVMHAYDMHHSPGAVVVSPAGTIASASVNGRRAIEALIRVTLAETAPTRVPVAPATVLPAA
jgi:peroxiredoxin